MEIDNTEASNIPKLKIRDIIPYACTAYDTRMEEPLLIDHVQRLRESWTNSAARITDVKLSIEHHCLAAILCYAMVRLVRAEKYDAFDTISAIALEHAGSSHQRVIDAWERANRSGFARPGVASRIALEAEMHIERQQMETNFDYGALLALCAHLPLSGIRNNLELAMRRTYQVAHNFLCRGGFDPEVVLAVHAVEQLERLGYEPGLVLRAIAVGDAWDLLNEGDISAEDAWTSALRDNGRMAEERVRNAQTERVVAAMDDLHVEPVTRDSSGNDKPSCAWVGMLSNRGLAMVDPRQVVKSNWINVAVYGEDMANIERRVEKMGLEQDGTEMWRFSYEEVTDEEVREFERMLED